MRSVKSITWRSASGLWGLAIVLEGLLVQPVAAQNSSPPSAAELAEYRRTCAPEIAGFEAAAQATSGGHADPGVVQRKIDEDYLIAVSGGPGNPRYTAEEIRGHDAGMAAQLQRNLANVSAQQRPWFVAYQALYVCAARVGIRYASGPARAPSPSQSVAGNQFTFDGTWQNPGGTKRITIVTRPGGLLVTSDDARENGFYAFAEQRGAHPSYSHLRSYRNGTLAIEADTNNPNHIGFLGYSQLDLFRVTRPGATPARPDAVASRPAAPPRSQPAATTRQPIGPQALFDGVSASDVNRVRQMLDSGAVSVRTLVDDQGNMPLHVAAARCSVPMVQLLLARGAANDVRNRWNDSPLIIASVRCGAQSPVTQLLRAGATGTSSSAPATATASNDPLRRRQTLVHNPALVATQCVHVRPYGEPDSRGFSQSIVNECGRVVEVSWCSTDGECQRNGGNSWTLAASGQGSAYPVGRNPVRYGACFGRNSGGFAQGSEGQRIVCTGDAGARPR